MRSLDIVYEEFGPDPREIDRTLNEVAVGLRAVARRAPGGAAADAVSFSLFLFFS